MFRRWLRNRHEARMRARDYALYFIEMHGDAAEAFVDARFSGLSYFSYRGTLGRYVRRALHDIRLHPPSQRRRRRARVDG